MGYQKGTVILENGGRESGVILNARVFVKEAERASKEMFQGWTSIIAEAQKSNLVIREIQLIERPVETLRGVRQIVVNAKKALLTESFSAETPAKDAPTTLTALDEVFKRFSAFADDIRVTSAKGLTKGTFATTKEDADAHVKTGMDAVSRYALENKDPASNVFTITPPKDLELKRGVVAPAYGEKGGGVEVIFVNGSPDGTVSGPVKIPDK
jgi:hypothetical protein